MSTSTASSSSVPSNPDLGVAVDSGIANKVTKREVRAAEERAESIGVEYGGLVQGFAELNVTNESDVLDRLSRSFARLQLGGPNRDQTQAWCQSEAEQLARSIFAAALSEGRVLNNQKLNEQCWALVSGLAHTGLLGEGTVQNGTPIEDEREHFADLVGECRKLTERAQDLSMRLNEQRDAALPGLHKQMRHQRDIMFASGSQFSGAVRVVAEYGNAQVVPESAIATWGDSYRRDVQSHAGGSRAELDAAGDRWLTQQVEYYLTDLARVDASVDPNDPTEIRQAEDLIIHLVKFDVFETRDDTRVFLHALSQYREAQGRYRKASADYKARGGISAVASKVGLSVAGGTKDLFAFRSAYERDGSKAKLALRILGVFGITCALANRTYVGVAHGLDEILTWNHLDFDLLHMLGGSGGGKLQSAEAPSPAASASAAAESSAHPKPSAVASSAPGAQPTATPAPSASPGPTAPAPEAPGPGGQSGGAEAQPPQFTMTMEAGSYGNTNENPGDLTSFAKIVLAEHGIDQPTDSQVGQVRQALIESNRTDGPQHGIEIGQQIDLSKGHQVVDNLIGSPAPAAEAAEQGTNPEYPDDWPENVKQLPESDVQSLKITEGESGVQLLESIGGIDHDAAVARWNDIAPQLHERYPDMVYVVGIDSNGNVVDVNSNAAVFKDYRLAKKGYMSWAFFQMLFDLLDNRRA